jgi:NAD(P)-dependent dehydrogenase (short-subunit alcohol dehydrogenase family)
VGFGLDDFAAFAALSGDHNPIHVDPLQARRLLFGAPVAHGMHVLLWAVEEADLGAFAFDHLRCEFRQPVRAGDEPQVAVERRPDGVHLRIECEGRLVARIEAAFSPRRPAGAAWPAAPPEPCRDLSYAEAAKESGRITLGHDDDAAARLFPRLAAALPPEQLSTLLAISRLVGMRCPGRHSLLSRVDIRFEPGAPFARDLDFAVTAADPRLGALRLALRGPGVTAEVDAVYRPAPVVQAPFTAAVPHVAAGEFGAARALVIGGSRGLGEAAAKVLAAGGAEVRLTFHVGAADAERVVTEIVTGGGRADCRPCDVLAPSPLSEVLADGWRPTHLLYFATPFIALGESLSFSPLRFRAYCRYYVEGLVACVETLAAADAEGATVFYPSTTALDEVLPRAAEYAGAKAAGEAVVRHLARRFPRWRFHAPRLPRVHTDRTASVMPVPAEEAMAALMPRLREMFAGR